MPASASRPRPATASRLQSSAVDDFTTVKDDVAASKVSAFLSDSRVIAERVKICKNSGCAHIVTGLTPAYCCRICAKSPGAHGPKCAKKLLTCATPGCGYAVTGLTEKHCCRMCAGGGDHGPNCWCLQVELAEKPEAIEDEENICPPIQTAVSIAEAPAMCEPCVELTDEQGSPSTSEPSMTADPEELPPAIVACSNANAAWAAASGILGPGPDDDDEPVDVTDAEVLELEEKAEANRRQMDQNAAIIQALKEQLAARMAGAA